MSTGPGCPWDSGCGENPPRHVHHRSSWTWVGLVAGESRTRCREAGYAEPHAPPGFRGGRSRLLPSGSLGVTCPSGILLGQRLLPQRPNDATEVLPRPHPVASIGRRDHKARCVLDDRGRRRPGRSSAGDRLVLVADRRGPVLGRDGHGRAFPAGMEGVAQTSGLRTVLAEFDRVEEFLAGVVA